MAMPLAEEFDCEEPVIDAIRGGDRYAFEELVRRQGRWVRGVIYGVLGNRECVDDVAQQVWSAVWQRSTELRDTKSWRSWLYALARNAAVDAGRDITRRRTRVQSLVRAVGAGAATPPADGPVIRDEQHREVLDAIQALPALYREPFVLRHVNGWTYREIAEVMGLPVDSVETRLVRARRFLRETLKGKLEVGS